MLYTAYELNEIWHPRCLTLFKRKKIVLEVAGVLDFELMRQHFKVQGQCLEITGQSNIKKKTKIALP
jgi:hypothetical protein